jgi:AcrR family transcriptional regulator
MQIASTSPESIPMTSSATSVTSEPRRSARERLLAAADELFYAEGVQSVGIDRVIERAGVAKASLYHCFSSKEELVATYLKGRQDQIMARITAATATVDDPREKILAVFDSLAQRLSRSDFRGCAFAAASTEAPSGGLVEEVTDGYRNWIRGLFTSLAGDAGAADASRLGRQLQMLYDGSALAARMDHRDPDIATSAREAAEILLDASMPRRSRTVR